MNFQLLVRWPVGSKNHNKASKQKKNQAKTMITTKINILPYLAEYLVAKMNNYSFDPFSLPDDTDLYHLVWQLMARRPSGVSPTDEGNVSLILPHRRIGKDPQYFNYLSPKSQTLIARNIKAVFDLDLHEALNENVKKGRPLRDIDVVHRFMCDYGIDSVSEDALIKNYYRWRDSLRRRNAHKRKQKLKE
jgi:hypothetical protein